MSRCVLDDEDRGVEVVIGWDPGMETYFVQVLDPKLSSVDPEADPAAWVIWTGGADRKFYTTPNDVDYLIGLITPYAAPFNKAILRHELLKDKAKDDGDRNYSIIDNELMEF